MKECFPIEPVQNKSLPEKKESRWEKAGRALAVAAVLTTAGAEAAREKKEEPKETETASDPALAPKRSNAIYRATPAEKKPQPAELPEEIFVPEKKQEIRLALDWKTDDPEFFVKHEDGEYSKEERVARRHTLPNGERILIDAGMAFYLVEKGDTIFAIRKKLSRYEEFSYLEKQKVKIKSFNIPPTALRPGMWIPIPLENKERVLGDEKFVEYSRQAIAEMRQDPRYGKFVEALLSSISETELFTTMLAVARQESGGAPLGQFEFHRYEKRHKAFSFSLFHVLMKGAGLDARRGLDLTEGQLYHPQNAAKLFLAFLFEKMNADRLDDAEMAGAIAKLFPIHKNLAAFSRFYNGKLYWKSGYDKHILKQRMEAAKVLARVNAR